MTMDLLPSNLPPKRLAPPPSLLVSPRCQSFSFRSQQFVGKSSAFARIPKSFLLVFERCGLPTCFVRVTYERVCISRITCRGPTRKPFWQTDRRSSWLCHLPKPRRRLPTSTLPSTLEDLQVRALHGKLTWPHKQKTRVGLPLEDASFRINLRHVSTGVAGSCCVQFLIPRNNETKTSRFPSLYV